MKYTIFKTKWGYFGLAATDNGLLRTVLPLSTSEKIKRWILTSFVGREPSIEFDKALFKTAQEQITAYFEGVRVNFRNIPIVLDGLSLFAKRVLRACRDIEFGQTVTYGRLAEMAGKPGSARAVGGALAKNPLPLIIPCHRVICANGKIGGFSAIRLGMPYGIGGVRLKKRLLRLEGADLLG